MENICSGDGWLCLYSKHQSLYHNLRLFSSPFLNKHDYGKQMIEKYKGCHVFYDPMTEYVENIYSGNGGLCVCSKYQIPCDNLLTLSPSFLIKCDEGAQ